MFEMAPVQNMSKQITETEEEFEGSKVLNRGFLNTFGF